MSFLQPWLLLALPLAALPIVIHLINQRRFQTVRWGAMMFLLAANRMARGYARLRQWLILLARVLTIVGLIFAISRPLASGWLGFTGGGRPDATLVLMDRSPSMQQAGSGSAISKRETGLRRLVDLLQTLGATRPVLIESSSAAPRELTSLAAVNEETLTGLTAASCDIPAMLETAQQYLKVNRLGRTDLWICSDLRSNDWQPESNRWSALRDSIQQLPQGVRIHLLAYADPGTGNFAVRVTDARRVVNIETSELVLSLVVSRQGKTEESASIPLQFEIGGARSELTIDFRGDRYELKDHRIPLDRNMSRGWGKVTLPADSNAADNDFFFVFDELPPRHTLLVVDDAPTARVLELAVTIAPDPAVRCTAEVISQEQFATAECEHAGLVIWQGPLPEGESAKILQQHVSRGRYLLCFPPKMPTRAKLFGVNWGDWNELAEPVGIESWRGDQDLLARTLSGGALPVGDLKIQGHAMIEGESTKLAILQGGSPLLVRAETERGGAYFCGTQLDDEASSLAANGVVLYVMLQRALAEGSASLTNTRTLIAGNQWADASASWQRMAGDSDVPSNQYAFQKGAYAEGEELLVVNRDPQEDQATVVNNVRLNELFEGLEFARVDDQAGTWQSLVQEVWRLFLVAMIAAMIGEACLCLPRPVRAAGASG